MGEDGTDGGIFWNCISPLFEICLISTIKIVCIIGKKRLDQLLRNTRYFRQKLRQLGLIVYGNDDSPVVPVILFMPAKMPYDKFRKNI